MQLGERFAEAIAPTALWKRLRMFAICSGSVKKTAKGSRRGDEVPLCNTFRRVPRAK